jgi:hypothetical protein
MRRRANLGALLVISVFFVTIVYSTANGKTIYVDDDAVGANNGSSWFDAYVHLQDALTSAQYGDEVRVGKGIYKPDQGASQTPGDREATFQLINGIAVKGGYAGLDGPDPNVRDFILYETVLSGDLNGDDGPSFSNNSENSYHVVTGSTIDTTAVLDGVTITGGNASGIYPPDFDHTFGGGMYLRFGRPTVLNCTFSENCATSGGGVCCFEGPPPPTNSPCGCATANVIVEQIFYSDVYYDRCHEDQQMSYDAIYEDLKKSETEMSAEADNKATFINCKFKRNSAGIGSGMSNWSASPTMINCTFCGNEGDSGGGVKNIYCSPRFVNCTFCANSANGSGGGMFNDNYSYPKVVNCILWGNKPNQIFEYHSFASITYSDIQGGWSGEGNIDADPCFTDANNGDFHLKSQTGRWDTNSESWVKDFATSPCIDKGNPHSDYTSELWPHGGRINMGIFGGTPEASMSLSSTGNIADLNIDGWVDYKDMKLFTDKWSYKAVLLAEDLDRSGFVNFTDFATLSDNWEWLFQPLISITKPKDRAEFAEDATIKIEAVVIDSNGVVVKVEFFSNESKIGEDVFGFDGWKIQWQEHTKGFYRLTATASQLDGSAVTSLAVRITLLPPPGQASEPSPTNGVTDVNTLATLSWKCGSDATSHDIYFGTNPAPDINEFQGNQISTYFNPGGMAYSTKYYWRVDEINVAGKSAGIVWNFTTLPPFPGQASDPSPTDGAIDVDSSADLNWATGHDAVSHDVYFGMNFPLTFMGNQTSNIFDPGLMNPLTKYYWRIDEVNRAGKNTGQVWSFTTKESEPPPPPPT